MVTNNQSIVNAAARLTRENGPSCLAEYSAYKLAERRPYRECRKKTAPSYKDISSDSDDDYHEVDSSFNQSLEPECIEEEKRLIKIKPVARRLAEVTQELAGCKLDGSAIVFEDSDLEEVVEEGVIVGEPNEPDLNMPDDAVDFEDENAQDGDKALEYSRTLVMPFSKDDIAFWFTQIENEMLTCTIKSQWMKRVVLVKNLPPEVQADVKALLRLKKTEAPTDIYKQVKMELLRLHAPKCEDNFKKALGRVLTGLPSPSSMIFATKVRSIRAVVVQKPCTCGPCN